MRNGQQIPKIQRKVCEVDIGIWLELVLSFVREEISDKILFSLIAIDPDVDVWKDDKKYCQIYILLLVNIQAAINAGQRARLLVFYNNYLILIRY